MRRLRWLKRRGLDGCYAPGAATHQAEAFMIGFTLSPEQVRAAPPAVRQWLEAQISQTFGLDAPAGGEGPAWRPQEPQAGQHAVPPSAMPAAHQTLVACGVDDIRAIMGLIQKLPPVALVLFDLAREPAMIAAPGIRALQVAEMVRHCHLQAPEQIATCVETLNAALRRLSGKPGIAMAVVDRAGHCLVADSTAQAILAVWQDLVGAHQLATVAHVGPHVAEYTGSGAAPQPGLGMAPHSGAHAGPIIAAVVPPLFAPPYMTTVALKPDALTPGTMTPGAAEGADDGGAAP